MYKAILSALVCLLAPLSLAQQAFLEIDSIPGESLVLGYEDQIVLTDWSQGVVNLGSGAVVLPFRFSHRVDRASPLLVQAALVGADLGQISLRATLPGGTGDRFEYLKLDLDGAVIVSVKSRADAEARAFEEVVVDCTSFTLTYTPQLATGAPGNPVVTSGTCGT